MSTDSISEEKEFPIFVRKLDRKGHWYCGEEREASEVAFKCFRETSDERYSLYECRDASCLAIIMGGLHLSRGLSGVENIDYIFFTKPELEAVGAKFHTSDGDTPCRCCNLLHVDIEANRDSLLSLCNSTKHRLPIRYSRSDLKNSLETLETAGCSGFVEQGASKCFRYSLLQT